MRTRRLGDSGPELTTVGFGSWAVGGPWRFGWGAVDDDESIAAIRHAVELGVNWVDTAAVYGLGHSEEVVGRALAPYRTGEDVFVFTKCGRRWEGRAEGEIGNDLRPESIREECESSLRRLGVERIDLYQVHWPDRTTGTPIEDSWATLAALVDEGKVRWIGVSNFDVELLDRCEAVRHVDSVQPTLSMLARGVRRTVLPWASAHGTGILCYSPLASGILAGGIDMQRLQELDEGDWRRSSPAFQEPAVSQSLAFVDRLRIVADGLGVDSTCARRRLGARAAGRHGRDRRCADDAARRRLDHRVGARARQVDAPRDRQCAGRDRRRIRRAAQAAATHRRAERQATRRAPPMRLGLLSTARINDAILAAAAESDRVDVVAVASRDEERARLYADEHGIARAHGSYEALLGDSEIDAIYVSLPNALHHEWTMSSLRAGKHVLCEKPYSRDPADVEQAFATARSAGLVLMEAFMYRHHPQTHAIAALVRDGALGKLLSVRSTFTFPLARLTDVRAKPELAGGALMDVGCYCVSGTRLIAGEPRSVFGTETKGRTGVDMAFYGTMQFADDVVGQFEASFVAPQRQALEVVGDEAVLMAFAPWRTDWPGELRMVRPNGSDVVPVPSVDAYVLELENMADAVAGVAPAQLDGDDALGQARTIDALYRSAESGAVVHL